MDKQVKMRTARQVLAAAETAVGVVGQDVAQVGQVPSGPARQTPDAVPESQHAAGPGTDRQGLAVPGPLQGLLPGGLRPGTVAEVRGSTTVLLALAQAVAGAERWCVLAGMPDVGWAAAAMAGLDLGRVVAVPQPGPDAAGVLGALVDGFDVLLVGPCPHLSPAGRRSLRGRLRQRGAVLLTDQHWPGAHLSLQIQSLGWQGVGHGHGLLTRREILIQRLGRGRLGGPVQSVRVLAGAHGLSALPGPEVTGLAGVDPAVGGPGAPGPAVDRSPDRPVLAEVG